MTELNLKLPWHCTSLGKLISIRSNVGWEVGLKVVWVGSVLVVGTKRDKRVRFPPEPLVMCGASFDHRGFSQNVATTTFYLAQVAFFGKSHSPLVYCVNENTQSN